MTEEPVTRDEFLAAQRLGLLSMDWEYSPDGVYFDGEYRSDGVYVDGSGDYEPPLPIQATGFWILGKYRCQNTPQHGMAEEWMRLSPNSLRRPVLFQTHEYREAWPLVDVTLELFPDAGAERHRQAENVILRVTIREALTEQEKSTRRNQISLWEEETLRKANFKSWNPDKDDFLLEMQKRKEQLRRQLQDIEEGGVGPPTVPSNMVGDPDKVQAFIDMRAIDDLLQSTDLSIERLLDLEELMRDSHLIFLSPSWPDDPDEIIDYWRTLQQEQIEGWKNDLLSEIRQLEEDRIELISLTSESNSATRASILHDAASKNGINLNLALEVEQVFRMASLKAAVALAEKMLDRGGADCFYYERFWPLKEFKLFNEIFRENFDLHPVEPDDEDRLDGRVREMFR